MNDAIIELKVITREEAIDRSVWFLKSASCPNLLPSKTQLNKGIAGIIMFCGDATKANIKAKEHAFFQIYKEPIVDSILLTDIVDFIYFYDRMPDGMLYWEDINTCLSYVVGDGMCGMVPATLVGQSKIVSECIKKLKGNTDQYFRDFFKNVTNKLFTKQIAETNKVAANEKTPFRFISEPTELTIYDRLGIVSFYESYNSIVVEDGDHFLLVALSENKYVKIHRTMAKYNSIRTILENAAWKMTKNV